MKLLNRLIGALRGCCHSLPDLRQGGDVRYTMADIGLSAFSLFFMQSPSFLAHQRRLEEGQGESIKFRGVLGVGPCWCRQVGWRSSAI